VTAVAAALLTTVVPMLVGQRWLDGHALARWTLGGVLGLVILAFGTMLGGFAGAPVSGAAAALLAAWFLGPRVRWRLPEPRLDPAARRVVLLLLCVGALVLALATMRPVAGWDGWFMWSLKSKSLAAEGSFSTPVFLSATYDYSSQDYPPLLPGWQAVAYRITGDLTVSWPLQVQQAWLWLVAAIGIVTLLSGVSRVAVLLPLAWLISPQVVWESTQSYADVPLALQLVLGAIVLHHAADWRGHVIGGVLLGGAALTKTEGLPLAAIVLVCLLVRAGHGWLAVIAPLVAAGLRLPWVVFTRVHGLDNHMIGLGSFNAELLAKVPDRLPVIWSLMGQTAVSPFLWGLLTPACLVAIVVSRRGNWRLGTATVLAVLLFTAVYALWPYRSWALADYMTVNVDRVLISCLGLLALAASLPGRRQRPSARVPESRADAADRTPPLTSAPHAPGDS
jgi:hypothetical protein